MIPYSHNNSQFKATESNATLTRTKKNIMHHFTHRFAHHEGLNKAYNGAECKCVKLPKIISRDSITQLTGPTGQIIGSIMHSSQVIGIDRN
ncbi:hypothetical protein H5410_061612 [Solanum commersonii]|uniref:Uncharacterized protein n=1 Tax=Solanum commersonii TaxID=4109 RepID=A0A9J5WA53_SOLCO|nr:hypothetical protein H5410_061612 [Solanum commersonii]